MASGYSRRMGRNKLLLPLGGGTVIGAVLDLVATMDYAVVAVVSQYDEILALAAERGMRPVANRAAAQGKSGSIQVGVAALSELTTAGLCPQPAGIIFFTGDQIHLNKALLTRLQNAFIRRPTRIVFPSYGGKIGSPAIFPADLAPRLAALRGEEGGMKVAAEQKERIWRVPVPAAQAWRGLDFDTWDDWLRSSALWADKAGDPGRQA
jgi:molybdenum cofactor cytidylyltransferase